MSADEGAPAPLMVDGITFRYRARPKPALHDVSFTLHEGELLLLAGTSGCGKTTLIRCINGLIPRSYKGDLSGRILLNGRETADLPLSRLSQRVGAEDIIDAMDLRTFGIGPRTWVHRLTYRTRDKLLIAISALIFAGSTVLSFMGVGNLWVPQALLRLARG